MTDPATLLVVPFDVDPGLDVGEVARRLAHRDRVSAWSGAWYPGALVSCDPQRVGGAGEDPFALLAELPAVDPDPAHPDAVGGGWFGYLGFPARVPAGFPRFSLAFHRDLLRHDGERWWYEALLDEGFTRSKASARRDELRRDLERPSTCTPARLELTAEPDATAHVVAVERCVQAIRRGEIYQANIASHLELRLHGSPHDAFARLVAERAPARAALVADPAGTAVSAGPELFLHRRGRRVRTAPIKGTRPRTGGVEDEAQRSRLGASAKDAAENVMIVDLMRNDLSRVCGTVTVPHLLELEPHAGVWHLVSTVEADLGAAVDDADLLAATFPPGSVTGAPKARAIALIEEFEGGPRGLFTGALGFASPLAGLELSVAIRTLEIASDGATRIGVGGGVTVDSTPVEEWAECLTKAAPILATLGAGSPRPPARTAGLADPGAGLFETLRAVGGQARRLADHVARLRASYVECYGTPLTADVAAAVTHAVAGLRGDHRVRVDAHPSDPGAVAVRAVGCPPPVPVDDQPGLDLWVHPIGPGGSERHKFTDRAWIEAIEVGLGSGRVALLVDDRDQVLESTRCGVVMIRDGIAVLPPLDGRILAGTGRRALLDALDDAATPWSLRPFGIDELASADGALLVNALRGVRWVRGVGGPGRPWIRFARPEKLTRRLAPVLAGGG